MAVVVISRFGMVADVARKTPPILIFPAGGTQAFEAKLLPTLSVVRLKVSCVNVLLVRLPGLAPLLSA
jgi:hypothetical protein